MCAALTRVHTHTHSCVHQVTFAVGKGRRIPSNQAAPVAMPGLAERQVYTHSFDGFGLQVRGRGRGDLLA